MTARLVNLPGGRLSNVPGLKQIPFATALALTRTGRDIAIEGKRLLQRNLRRVRPYTLRAVNSTTATKQSLATKIDFAERLAQGIGAGKYLKALEFGGQRAAKPSERRLRAKGVLAQGELLAAIPGGPFDTNAPVVGSRWARLVRVLESAGTATPLRRGKVKDGNVSRTYFRAGNAIYERTGKRKATPVLVVIRSATYRATIGFGATADRVAKERFPRQWELAVNQALVTAR